MGNLPKQQYTFHSNSVHPIQGEVPVWSIKHQGKFVMRIKIQPQLERIELFEKIGKEESFHLVKYFGNVYENQHNEELMNLNITKNIEEKPMQVEKVQKGEGKAEKYVDFEKIKGKFKSFKIERKNKNERYKEKGLLFFEFLNYDLKSFLTDVKMKEPKARYVKPEEIIEIIDAAVNAAITLAKFTIFIDFNFKIIEFAASRQPQIYWAHVLPNNMHRPFLRYFDDSEKIERSLYSPEELLSLNHDMQSQKCLISMEKSSVFSLGMVILECLTLLSSKQLYDYEHLRINTQQMRKRIKLVLEDKRYSKQVKTCLQGMLMQKNSQRFGFKQILLHLYS